MSPQEAIDHFGHTAELGFDHAIFSMPNVYEPDAFEVFHDIAPAIHAIPVAGR